MGWGLTRWIVSLRAVQLMGSFIPGALNGWLLYYIGHKHIGLSLSMIILQILVCCLHQLLITTLQCVCPLVREQPLRNRERSAYWMATNV